MADKDAASAAEKAASQAVKAAPEGNPAFRMMGLPNIKFKLPSRNWMIFLTITGSWTAAVVYDRQQKKRIQKKWCKLVEHLKDETLPLDTLPRKLTLYVEAPPADGLMSARDHFHDYIKPILVAGAMDWDAVEGRRQGDIRAGVAERIRKFRRDQGEAAMTRPEDNEPETAVEELQRRQGIKPYHGVQGDIVIGRHTWKEYIRGLHEGWLGPMDPPVQSTAEKFLNMFKPDVPSKDGNAPSTNGDDASPTSSAELQTPTDETKTEEQKAEEAKKEEEEKKKSTKRKQPPPFNTVESYPKSLLPLSAPSELPPSVPIQMPHLLGFLNTPVRMWRFLNRRQVAEDTGRQTAAAVLGLYRPYHSSAQTFESSDQDNDTAQSAWEQDSQLEYEESNWHKSVRNPKDDEEEAKKEKIWMPKMVLDERIATRMRKFELDQELEARAEEIEKTLPPWWYFGYGGSKDSKEIEEQQ